MPKKLFVLLTALLMFCSAAAAYGQQLPDFTQIAKQTGPAVVNISTEKTVERKQLPFMNNMPKGTPFDEFFEQFGMQPFGGQLNPQTRKEKSLGSGFIISQDGYVVTNNHVVENATSITVNLQTNNGKTIASKAEVVGTDPDTDLALLKIKADSTLPFLQFGDSDALEVGEWVVAIGNPFGLDHSVTKGIISAKGRNIQAGPFDSFLQTDASINPGNSGGPLIDMRGKVIGINTAIIASGQGIGFAIPSNMAENIIAQLKDDKVVKRGWLGVQIQAVDETTAKALGLAEAKGALVGEVFPSEPAAKAGVQAGDIILKINGAEVQDNSDLLHKVAAFKPNSKIEVTVWREGKEKNLSLTLGNRDNMRAQGMGGSGGSGQNQGKNEAAAETVLGMKVRPPTPQEANALGYDGREGLLVVNIAPDKAAQSAGLKEGDLLLSANLRPLANTRDLQDVMKEATKKGAVMFKVLRRGQAFFLAIPMPKE